MALSLLTGALIKMGGGELAKNLTKSAGGAFLNHISETLNIPVGDPAFDEAAAAHVATMDLQAIKRFEAKTADTEKARQFFLKNKDDDTPRVIIDRTYMLLVLCIIVQVVVVVLSVYVVKDITIAAAGVSSMTSMLMGALLKQMSSQSDFYFGSSFSSQKKDTGKNNLIDRLIDNDEKQDKQMQTQYAAQIETQRRAAPPAQAASHPLEDDLFAPDLDESEDDEESLDKLISETRRT